MNTPSKRTSTAILGSAVALVIAGGGAGMWLYFAFLAQRLFHVVAGQQLYPESGLEVVAIASLGFFSFTIGVLIGTVLWAMTMRSFFEREEVVAGLRRLTATPDPVLLWILRRVYRDEP